MFSLMLEEILMDVVQQSHKEIARARAVCDVCHTRCVRAVLPALSLPPHRAFPRVSVCALPRGVDVVGLLVVRTCVLTSRARAA